MTTNTKPLEAEDNRRSVFRAGCRHSWHHLRDSSHFRQSKGMCRIGSTLHRPNWSGRATRLQRKMQRRVRTVGRRLPGPVAHRRLGGSPFRPPPAASPGTRTSRSRRRRQSSRRAGRVCVGVAKHRPRSRHRERPAEQRGAIGPSRGLGAAGDSADGRVGIRSMPSAFGSLG